MPSPRSSSNAGAPPSPPPCPPGASPDRRAACPADSSAPAARFPSSRSARRSPASSQAPILGVDSRSSFASCEPSSLAAFGCFPAPPYNTRRSHEPQMTEQTTGHNKSRRQMLEELVAKKPDDAFSRYGLALECMNSGDSAAADQHFRALLERNADYIPAYLMYGQLLVRESRPAEARVVLSSGITAADKKGDQHARSEMETLLL